MCSRRVKQFLFSNKEPSVSLIVFLINMYLIHTCMSITNNSPETGKKKENQVEVNRYKITVGFMNRLTVTI
jgi:hypothetical protein